VLVSDRIRLQPVTTGLLPVLTTSSNVGNQQPQPIPDWGNRNRKSGCHQSGSVGFTVFFQSYALDFQTLFKPFNSPNASRSIRSSCRIASPTCPKPPP
jgi:hypothetical protein